MYSFVALSRHSDIEQSTSVTCGGAAPAQPWQPQSMFARGIIQPCCAAEHGADVGRGFGFASTLKHCLCVDGYMTLGTDGFIT